MREVPRTDGARYRPSITGPDDTTDTPLREAGVALANAITASIGAWVVGCVERRMIEERGSVPPEVADAAESAGRVASIEIGAMLRSLVERDVDEQATTPITLVRSAVTYPTKVLVDAGLPARERDAFSLSRFPDDIFDLTPASLSVLGDEVGELGIVWGAAKAFEHKRRHRR